MGARVGLRMPVCSVCARDGPMSKTAERMRASAWMDGYVRACVCRPRKCRCCL